MIYYATEIKTNYVFSRENDVQKSIFLGKLKKINCIFKRKKHFVNCQNGRKFEKKQIKHEVKFCEEKFFKVFLSKQNIKPDFFSDTLDTSGQTLNNFTVF